MGQFIFNDFFTEMALWGNNLIFMVHTWNHGKKIFSLSNNYKGIKTTMVNILKVMLADQCSETVRRWWTELFQATQARWLCCLMSGLIGQWTVLFITALVQTLSQLMLVIFWRNYSYLIWSLDCLWHWKCMSYSITFFQLSATLSSKAEDLVSCQAKLVNQFTKSSKYFGVSTKKLTEKQTLQWKFEEGCGRVFFKTSLNRHWT